MGSSSGSGSVSVVVEDSLDHAAPAPENPEIEEPAPKKQRTLPDRITFKHLGLSRPYILSQIGFILTDLS